MSVVCDYCGQPAELVDRQSVCGTGSEKVWCCRECDAWVGVHRGTIKPLGRLANAELRRWKKRAHAAFDPMLQGKEKRTRRWAYEWLAGEMGLPIEHANISMMDVEECKRVIKICKEAKNHG